MWALQAPGCRRLLWEGAEPADVIGVAVCATASPWQVPQVMPPWPAEQFLPDLTSDPACHCCSSPRGNVLLALWRGVRTQVLLAPPFLPCRGSCKAHSWRMLWPLNGVVCAFSWLMCIRFNGKSGRNASLSDTPFLFLPVIICCSLLMSFTSHGWPDWDRPQAP